MLIQNASVIPIRAQITFTGCSQLLGHVLYISKCLNINLIAVICRIHNYLSDLLIDCPRFTKLFMHLLISVSILFGESTEQKYKLSVS